MKPKYIVIVLVAIAFLHSSSLWAQASDSLGTGEKYLDEQDEMEVEEEKDYYFVYRGYGEDPPRPDRRRVPEEKLERMRKEKGMWFVNVEPEKPQEPEKEERGDYTPLTERTWFQTLLWVLIIGGFGTFLAIYLTGDRVGLFRRASKQVGSDLSEEIPEDIFAINYDAEITKAERNGNYRAAVRLLFLQTLKAFADRGVIHYHEGKTNFDYLVELHPTSYYERFFRVTRAYEFTWYGKFHLEEPSYKLVKQDFEKLNRMVH